MEFLPRPEIIDRGIDESAGSGLSVLTLHWNQDAPGVAERTWHLPMHVSLKSAAPERFGMTVEPAGKATFRVRVVWNDLHLMWEHLTANQIMTGSLAIVMRALGHDLWQMLGQTTPLAA
jgi:hypothetical protein